MHVGRSLTLALSVIFQSLRPETIFQYASASTIPALEKDQQTLGDYFFLERQTHRSNIEEIDDDGLILVPTYVLVGPTIEIPMNTSLSARVGAYKAIDGSINPDATISDINLDLKGRDNIVLRKHLIASARFVYDDFVSVLSTCKPATLGKRDDFMFIELRHTISKILYRTGSFLKSADFRILLVKSAIGGALAGTYTLVTQPS